MTIELPDVPANERLTPEEARLELACALYARGRIGKVAATQMAGMDFFTFQRALSERGVRSTPSKCWHRTSSRESVWLGVEG